MATEKTTLRIKADRLGTVTEVQNFLADLDSAYNSIYAFDFLVDSMAYDRERNFKQLDERFHRMRKYWKEFSHRKEFPYDPFFFEMFWEDNLQRQEENEISQLRSGRRITPNNSINNKPCIFNH